jgi:hypothetical protein
MHEQANHAEPKPGKQPGEDLYYYYFEGAAGKTCTLVSSMVRVVEPKETHKSGLGTRRERLKGKENTSYLARRGRLEQLETTNKRNKKIDIGL